MKMKPLGETVTVHDMNIDGTGVARTSGGKVAFVQGAVTGDVVLCDVIKSTPSYDVCRVSEFLERSPLRCADPCPKQRCGGCAFGELKYEAELEQKERIVREALRRIGSTVPELERICAGSPERYRNKVAYPVAQGRGMKPVFGYYARRTHEIIMHDSCRLQHDDFAQTARIFLELAHSFSIPAYDEKNHRGIIRHLVMRRNTAGEMSLCVVVNGALPHEKKLSELMQMKCPHVKVFAVSINTERTNVIATNGCRCLYGEHITDTICGKTLCISPLSFYQVNRDMAEKLYLKAREYADCGSGILLDLYCGIGTAGLCIAGDDTKLFGVEIVPQAVEDARKNATMNGRSENDTCFVAGDASIGVRGCINRFGRPDVIVVDPPRHGLEREVIETVTAAEPERIVYISCNPATLARDAVLFADHGYSCVRGAVFDLFPRTAHVETVVLMSRSEKIPTGRI